MCRPQGRRYGFLAAQPPCATRGGSGIGMALGFSFVPSLVASGTSIDRTRPPQVTSFCPTIQVSFAFVPTRGYSRAR